MRRQPGRFFRASTTGSRRVTERYADGVALMIRARGARAGLVFAMLVAITVALWRDHAGLARARGGPGLLHRRGHPARRRVAGAHRHGRERGRRASSAKPGDRERGRVHRLRLPRRHVPQQRGDHLRHPEALGRAQVPVQALVGEFLGRRADIKDALVLAFDAAADLRPRQHRRLRGLRPEPRRGQLEAPRGGHAGLHRAARGRIRRSRR